MKILFQIFVILVIVSFSSCRGSGDLSIKVTDNDDMYKYSANFKPEKSAEIEKFINSRIAPTHISSDGELDVTTILADKTIFDYEASPGELTITLDKDRNSKASYQRIKRMCQELNHVINPQK